MSNSPSILENRDYTLIIDRSASMNIVDMPKNGRPFSISRWKAVEESTVAVANKILRLDPDGITVYVFNDFYCRYQNVNSTDLIHSIFRSQTPSGGTYLSNVLEVAFSDYFNRKKNGETKENGEILVVITDGTPNDSFRVQETIKAASELCDDPHELGVTFLQVGHSTSASCFLKYLDDHLNAKFDIVDTVTIDSIESQSKSLTEVLLGAIYD